MVTIRCKGYVGTGRTVDTAVRARFGRTAAIRWSADPTSPELGQIIKPVDARRRRVENNITRRFGHDTVLVLDTLLAVEEG